MDEYIIRKIAQRFYFEEHKDETVAPPDKVLKQLGYWVEAEIANEEIGDDSDD